MEVRVDDRESASRLLSGKLPSERAEAVRWFTANATAADIVLLTGALASETVPTVRNGIVRALRVARNELTLQEPVAEPLRPSEAVRLLGDFPLMIHHELGGAIGHVRYAASRELQSYDSSRTRRTIDSLVKRVNGLASLALLQGQPGTEELIISEVLMEHAPVQAVDVNFLGDVENHETITSDSDLLAIIFQNAYQNAAEGVATLAPPRNVLSVDWGTSGSTFWVSLTNEFPGAGFSLEEIRARGVTSKHDHRGLGIELIERACSRLGYDFDIVGSGGIANFTIWGRRQYR